jgi:arsenate reductase (thioredoxin)
MTDGGGHGGNRRGRPPMRGSSRLGPRTPVDNPGPFEAPRGGSNPKSHTLTNAGPLRAPASGRKLVLFVCIGNACRSQMAEAFARAYGADVLDVQSAGLSPAPLIPPLTRKVLADRNVSMGDHFPKGLETVRGRVDVLVNMSGLPLAVEASRVLNWPVQDPIGQTEMTYRNVAAQIEDLVMRLILELRASNSGR